METGTKHTFKESLFAVALMDVMEVFEKGEEEQGGQQQFLMKHRTGLPSQVKWSDWYVQLESRLLSF